MVDDFCHSRPQTEQHPGPDTSLSPSEVITLTIFALWSRFGSERDFYRYASSRLRDAFPTLPHRSQFIPIPVERLPLLCCIWPPVVARMAADRLSLLAQSYATLYESLFELVQALKEAVGHWLVGQRA